MCADISNNLCAMHFTSCISDHHCIDDMIDEVLCFLICVLLNPYFFIREVYLAAEEVGESKIKRWILLANSSLPASHLDHLNHLDCCALLHSIKGYSC